MIQKDIVYDIATKPTKDPTSKELNVQNSAISDIDRIFNNADMEMAQQSVRSQKKAATKKKKKHRLVRGILSFFLVLFLLIGAIIGSAIYSAIQYYPIIKSNFLDQIHTLQSDLMEVDDSGLSVDEYYQKQLLLLFSVEDIETMIQEVEDFENFIAILEKSPDADTSLIPQDKIDEYNQLIEDYHKAKAEEEKQAEVETSETDDTVEPT